MRRVAIALFFCALGCQRVADEAADVGPEVSREVINAALARAMSGVRTDGAAAGTFVSYQTVRRVGGSGAEVDLGSTTIAVRDAEGLRLDIDRRNRGEDGDFKTTREDVPLRFGADVIARAVDAPGRVTYHRLRMANETLAPSAAIRARPNCGGLVDCELHVRYVIFDLVSHPPDGGEVRKVTLTLGFSVETPYLPHGDGFERFDGALVVDCRGSTVRANGRSVSVRDCRSVTDFQN